jgi:hypothetical protein
MNIDKFEQQHLEILRHIDTLRRYSRIGVSENAKAIAQEVIAMSSVIKLHLAAEDRALYPALKRSGDAMLASLGERFQTGMGPIAEAFTAFAGRWNTEQRVRADAEGFRQAANETLRCLWERMRDEDRNFYARIKAAAALA